MLPGGPWGSTKVCLLTNSYLVTQLASRELVLLLAQDHGDMGGSWVYRSM